MRLTALSLALALGMAGCDDTGRKSPTLDSSSLKTPAERAARFSRIVRGGPPSPVADAQFVEVRTSGGSYPPAPSESAFVARVTLAPGDLAAWLARTTPIARPNVPPPPVVPWWMGEAEADSARYYDPRPLFGRSHGFVAVPDGGRTLYVYTFTM